MKSSLTQQYGAYSGYKLYSKEACDHEILSLEEEFELGKRIQQGDEKAVETLILSNLRFVVKIANEFQDRGLPLLDLISEGNIGLVRAARTFDPIYNVRFASYAVFWIKQRIKRALSNYSRTIRIPIHILQREANVRSTVRELIHDLGRNPSSQEVANKLKLTVEQVYECQNHLKLQTIPFEELWQNNFVENEMAEFLADPNGSVLEIDDTPEDLLTDLVSKLPFREKKIIIDRFGLDGTEPKTLEKIGEDFGVSRERIRQLEAQALRRLRSLFPKDEFPL